ncbi:TRAP transporter small permease [Anaerotruncus sp. AF02-27]|jgi:TRAP-type C4-dicarboxylate transport system permease small subunit|uniref:TRAP transporter small permease n=1 Tax=Anaerotruncus TaxID=244127 RepID=UPI000E4AC844|nr:MULTISPECIES: TRAP transporter small permease [Anaerotruncus]RGX55630.1 TRAP transporter small permease [Anaerotruncus sp. AF02-27]
MKHFIDNFEEYAGTAFTLAMGIAVTLGVISRLFELSLDWTSEVARYSFIWAVFLGAIVGTKRNSHIIIEVFINLFPEKVRKILFIVTNAASLLLLAILVYYGFILTAEFWDTKMSLLPYPMGLVYMSLPACSLLMFVRILQILWRQLKEFHAGKDGANT